MFLPTLLFLLPAALATSTDPDVDLNAPVVLHSEDPPCTVVFNQHSCFDRNASPDQIYFPSIGNSALQNLPQAYGDIPSTLCIDLQQADAPAPAVNLGKNELPRAYNENNCWLPDSTQYNVDPLCPHVPAGQFWVTNDQCAMHAIEVFDGERCEGNGFYWDMKAMKALGPDKVIKDDKGAWCAGPGKNLEMPVMIKSFRLLEGPPLPEPSGTCSGGKCHGGSWPGA